MSEHDETTRALPGSGDGAGPSARADERRGPEPGDELGRYRIESRIGEGGMGVVFRAWDPSLDRAVALKVLHLDEHGMGSEGRARILAEGQALARLAHPNVVEIFDVGLWSDYLFIAMELIEGETVKRWLALEPRPWNEVLPVLLAAGRGLVSAHAAGLVHRDFKPSNVLIGPADRVRVVDFGLATPIDAAVGGGASVVSGPSGSHSSRTVAGTPGYTAPEQWRGEPADARSDQFSFCVALYRALYGSLPYAIGTWKATDEPVRPGEPARTEGVPSWLWPVIARGLEPDPMDRYPSMEALLDALSPPRRARKGLVAGGGLVVAALAVAGLSLGSVEGPDPCRRGRERSSGAWNGDVRRAVVDALVSADAVRGPQTAERVEARLDAQVAAWDDAHEEVCGAEPSVEHDRAMACLDQRLDDLESVTEVLRVADEVMVGRAVVAVGSLATPAECTDAEALRREVPPPPALEAAKVATLRQRLRRASVDELAGRIQLAHDQIEAVAQEAASLPYAPLHAEIAFSRGHNAKSRGELAEAEERLEQAVLEARAAGYDQQVVRASIQLVFVVGVLQRRADEGLEWARHGDAALERLGGNPIDEASLARNRGAALEVALRLPQAREELQRSLSLLREHVGDEHPEVAGALNSLAIVEYRAGRYDEASATMHEAYDAVRRIFGPDHEKVWLYGDNLGSLHVARGDFAAALPLFEHSLSIAERTGGMGRPRTAETVRSLGIAYEGLGDYERARAAFERALALIEEHQAPRSEQRASALNSLGVFLRGRGELEPARERFEEALRVYEEVLSEDHPETARTRGNVGSILLRQGAPAAALEHFEVALRDLEAKLGPDHPHLVDGLLWSADALLALDRPEEALARLERGLVLSEGDDFDPVRGAEARLQMARVLERTGGDLERARTLARDAIERASAAGPGPYEVVDEARAWLRSLDATKGYPPRP